MYEILQISAGWMLTGRMGKSSQLLCNTNGKWVTDTRSKSTADCKQTHAKSNQRIPSQTDCQRNYDWNQRYTFFKRPDKRTKRHKEYYA